MENSIYAMKGTDPKFFNMESFYNRALSACQNISVPHIFRNYKLKNAANLLRDTDFKLDQIAYIVGFENAETMTKYFENRYETSPSQYREENQNSK